MAGIPQVPVRRSLDGSRRRAPLRISIGRRRIHSRAGDQKFVTQVQLGGGEAIVVPWTKNLKRARPAESPPARARVQSRPVTA